jgi:Ca2+-binding EF-hand superfamily protein
MKTQNKWMLVSIISTLAGVGVAAAQPGGGKHFERLDTNGDGTVTTAEFQAGALARWTEADANKDGKVTVDEFKAVHEAHRAERFSKEDTNGDGVLQRSEVAKMPDEFFAKLDANKDGALSKDEMASFKPKHHLGKGEEEGKAKRLPGDENQDGVVTKEEAIAGSQKWAKKIDANGDGTLTKEELMKGHPHHGPHGFHKGQGPRPAPSAE